MLKTLTAVALVAAQITATTMPAQAAEIVGAEPQRSQQFGTFVGARLRVPLDGVRREARATLTAAPTVHSASVSGEHRLRIGHGLELGLQGADLRFDLAGRPVARLAESGGTPEGGRNNVSTVGWVAIGVGAVAATLFALYALCGAGEICSTDDD